MALYEKTTTPTITDENDLGRSVKFYEAKDSAGATIRRCRIEVPGVAPYDGPLAGVLSGADITTLGGILGRGVRKVLTDQGFTVKP